MRAHLIEAQAAGFRLGVLPLFAQELQIVRAIVDGDVVERRPTALARGADEGIERDHSRAVALRVLFEEGLELARDPGAGGHGVVLLGTALGFGAAVESGFGFFTGGVGSM